jgi:hypothetical protein
VDANEIRRFSSGDVLIRQGSVGSFMFFISDGEVSIYVEDGRTVRALCCVCVVLHFSNCVAATRELYRSVCRLR